KQKLMNPEVTDPMSIATYTVLNDAIADRNFAFILPDQLIGLNFFEPKMFTATRGQEFQFSVDDKWMTLKDGDLLKSRQERMDRKKLGQVIRFVESKKRELTIEEKADFYSALPRDTANAYWMERLIKMVTPGPKSDSYSDPTGYRIYGAMSAGERQIASKAPIPLSKFSTELHKNLFYELFMVPYGSYPEVEYPENTQSQEEIEAYSKFMNKLYSGLMQEKTFLLPVGLTGDMTVKITESTEQVLSCVSPESSQYRNGRTMSPNQLGSYMFRKSDPKKYRWEVDKYNAIDEDRIWIASKRNVKIRLQTSKFVSFNWTLSQDTITDPKKYTATTLPPEIQKLVEQGYKEAKEQDKYYQTARPGIGGNPPPPAR
ncbi:MAG TPA: hypothetical protein VK171_06290, partial [Fimbriimonas sp.]|nr:hypothetical protein [Fimbriimonas sp.]